MDGDGTPAPTPSLVAALGDRERRALLALGRVSRYPRNAWVFHEGDRSDFVVVVTEGRLKIVATSASGGESVLGIRGTGSLVGELAAFDGGPRTASAIAMDPVQVRLVAATEFREFLARFPTAALELIRMLMGRLREGDRRRVEFGSYDATARVARLMCDLAAEHGPGRDGTTSIQLAQHEIAGLVGASRESVARALSVLRARRLVATARGRVVVLDVEGLHGFAG